MKTMSQTRKGTLRTAVLSLACTLSLLLGGLSSAHAQIPSSTTPADSSGDSATLEQCATSGVQTERSATFSGEMTAIAGSAKMAMRIDIEERLPGEVEFHVVAYPGLGVWRSAEAKVKVYKYLKQVTNLSSPAAYRGDVRFRWLNAKGRVIKRAERLTTRCLQPAAPVEQTSSTPRPAEPLPPSTTVSTPST